MKPYDIERDIHIVHRLMSSCHDRLCEALHHRAGDEHALMAPCPVAIRVTQAWYRLVEHLRDSIAPVQGKEGA